MRTKLGVVFALDEFLNNCLCDWVYVWVFIQMNALWDFIMMYAWNILYQSLYNKAGLAGPLGEATEVGLGPRA